MYLIKAFCRFFSIAMKFNYSTPEGKITYCYKANKVIYIDLILAKAKNKGQGTRLLESFLESDICLSARKIELIPYYSNKNFPEIEIKPKWVEAQTRLLNFYFKFGFKERYQGACLSFFPEEMVLDLSKDQCVK